MTHAHLRIVALLHQKGPADLHVGILLGQRALPSTAYGAFVSHRNT